MTMSLRELVAGFGRLEVLVVGDSVLDVFLDGSVGRVCREAPVPVVEVIGRRSVPGCAGNAAANVAGLGAHATLAAPVGEDTAGDVLLATLAQAGVRCAAPVRTGQTVRKQRLLVEGQLLARFDEGTTAASPAAERALLGAVNEGWRRADAVLISDYGLGAVTPRMLAAIGELQERLPRTLVVDAKDLRPYRTLAPTAVKPNWSEALALLGASPGTDRVERVATLGDRLLERTGAAIAAVTLDGDGALVLERGREPYRTYARSSHRTNATGAGDTYAAALALALAAGADTTGAAEFASRAADVVVSRPGTTCCTGDELLARAVRGEKVVGAVEDLVRIREFHRAQGRRVVFTNGCFDVLHRGHVTYLSLAKQLGDVLVVGVNSDESVRALKGPSRPVNGLADRVELLGALSCVDAITSFDDVSPARLIRMLRPDTVVKGGDYDESTLPEAPVAREIGAELRFLPLVAERSTTRIIDRIRELSG